MKVKRKIIEINEERCDGCGQCVPSCAEGAIEIVDGQARIVADKYCDGLGACLNECPKDALTIIEREAEDFDEEAVEEYLESKGTSHSNEQESMACGCPSALIQSFGPSKTCQKAAEPTFKGSRESALSHWPVQIKLVPPDAQFLKGAHLLVAADCTPFAYRDFHKDFLQDKVLMVGCPKLDETQSYIQKFTDTFKASDISSITVLTMEVPCCQGLPAIIKRAMELAGEKIPTEHVVISTRGKILKSMKLVA